MEVRRGLGNFKDPYIIRKQCIRAAQDSARVHGALSSDVCDLAMCMYTGVRPSGTRDRDRMIEQLLKGLLQLALDGPKLRLNLPAVEIRAVVSKCQLEVPHPIGYSMWLGERAMPGITATIITLNEQDRIAEAIASLACCDEVLVVDSGSTDRTCQIASARGAQVIQHSWESYSRQKNFAAEHASHDWILSIDADERLSAELADEIAKWKRNSDSSENMPVAAYSMPRRAFYLGQWINHSGWYPDRKVRLYDRRHCRWDGDFVHETLTVDGHVGMFSGDLLHFPFRTWAEQKGKIDRYTKLAALSARHRGVRGNVLILVLGPPITFMKSFILRGGFLDGLRGLAIAYTGARYVFLRQLRILRSWN